MILPTIHMKKPTTLTEIRNAAAYDAIDEALYRLSMAWGEVEFNALDYYPQGPDAYTKARQERLEQAAKLNEFRAYLDGIRQHLYDQLP